MSANESVGRRSNALLTLLFGAAVVAAILLGWAAREQRLIVASEGLGYWLGVTGALMMLLLLTYPLRKRARFLRRAGAVRHWFRVHMILGILGPLLVLLHSNFSLGSFNGRVALFCTIVVSVSGILGRYFYSKIHHGLYGQRATWEELKAALTRQKDGGSEVGALVLEALSGVERRTEKTPDTIGATLWLAASIGADLRAARSELREKMRGKPHLESVEAHVLRLFEHRRRLLRKFAQLRAFERLFSLWHVTHYPLFIVMVIAALVHVVAVHMY